MVIKLPGRTLASAGMKSPPELASKIVTPTTSPLPKRISLGRLRSGNSPTSLGNALPKTLATLGVIRTKAYGIFLGSCCPAHTSQLSGPATGIKAQPPTARCDTRSVILKRMPTPRTVALPPRNLDINASNYVRSTRLLSGIVWKWLLYWTRVAGALHRWAGRQGSGNTTPRSKNTPKMLKVGFRRDHGRRGPNERWPCVSGTAVASLQPLECITCGWKRGGRAASSLMVKGARRDPKAAGQVAIAWYPSAIRCQPIGIAA